ncbi:hypothetical protein SD455_11185 [Nesterenkonia sp. K-15-9-6]
MSSACALTMAAGLVGCTDLEPEVVTETVTETITEEVEVEVEPEDLQEQRDAADERDEELDTREAELDEREGELEDLEEALAAREQRLEEAEESQDEPDSEPDDTDEAESGGSTIPGDGVYMVGSDVDPGTYTTEPGSWGCYWARLSGTSGEFHDIITNAFVEGGQALVTIAETDVAFETSGCGTWEKQ